MWVNKKNVETLQYNLGVINMKNKPTKEIRGKENKAITEHLSAIKKIIAGKCKRCDSMYGCLGCVFSEGEMMYNINHSFELMERCKD